MKSYRHPHGVFLALAMTVAMAGCASTGAPLPPTLELPQAPADLAAQRKGDRVYLTWTDPTQTTDRQSVRRLGPTRICRTPGTLMERCEKEVGQVPAPKIASAQAGTGTSTTKRTTASYNDTIEEALRRENPPGQVTYAVEVLNTNGKSAGLSNRVQVPTAPTLSPSTDFKAELTAAGVELSWPGMAEQHINPEISHRYRIYRQEGSERGIPIAELAVNGAGPMNFVDHSFEWERKYDYRLTVVTVVSVSGKPEVQVEGDDTPAIQVTTHDVFPPAVPSGLQAVFSGFGQEAFVDLIWAPDTDTDLAGYNVYRSTGGSQPLRLNTELVKAPAYRDGSVSAEKKYVYSVSAVDTRGNESARSDEAEENVP